MRRWQLGQLRICWPFCRSLKIWGGIMMWQPWHTPSVTGTMTGFSMRSRMNS